MHGAVRRNDNAENPPESSHQIRSLFLAQPSSNSTAAHQYLCIQQLATYQQRITSRGRILMLALVFALSSTTNTNRPGCDQCPPRRLARPDPGHRDQIRSTKIKTEQRFRLIDVMVEPPSSVDIWPWPESVHVDYGIYPWPLDEHGILASFGEYRSTSPKPNTAISMHRPQTNRCFSF